MEFSPSQDLYTHIHTLSEIRTHDPSFLAVKDHMSLRTRDHCKVASFFIYRVTYLLLGVDTELIM